MYNQFKISFLSKSGNQAFARNVVAMFILDLNPTVAIINDVKTAVSEAVTNAIIHGYPDTEGEIELSAKIENNVLHIQVKDNGVGITNLEKALEPTFTTGAEGERSGMGFTVMQAFMDEVNVTSSKNVGTTVKMSKNLLKAV